MALGIGKNRCWSLADLGGRTTGSRAAGSGMDQPLWPGSSIALRQLSYHCTLLAGMRSCGTTDHGQAYTFQNAAT